MFECSNVQMFKCFNIPMFQSSNVPMFQCSNVQMFKCSNIQMSKCSNVQMFLLPFNIQIRVYLLPIHLGPCVSRYCWENNIKFYLVHMQSIGQGWFLYACSTGTLTRFHSLVLIR